MDLVDRGWCFACGENNPIGLKVEFELDSENMKIFGRFTPRREHQGYEGIMHGGLVSTLLDEAMVKLLWDAGIPAVSARLEIRLLKPVRVGSPVVIEGWVESVKGRLVHTGARLTDGAGDTLAEAGGRCLKIPKEDRIA
jgi:acyl-coenzyme A thioesterase PaaI-like protein